MPTTTLRPNSDYYNTGVTRSSGGVDNTLLADNLDTSYDRFIDASSSGMAVGMQTYAPGAGSLVKSVTPRVRAAAEGVGFWYNATMKVDLLFTGIGILNGTSTNQQYLAGTTITTYTIGAWTRDVVGGSLDSLLASGSCAMELIPSFPNPGSATATFRAYEFYLDVLYANPPTNTVPTITNGLTSTPTATWTYSAGTDGGPQTLYEIKAFDAATYGGGGFSPDTSTAAYSATSTSSAVTATVPTGYLVAGTTYKIYIRVSQTVNGFFQPSVNGTNGWQASAAFTPAAAPVTPTLVATTDSANSRIVLTVTGKDNLVAEQDASLDLTTGTGNWANTTNVTISRNTNVTFTDGDIASLQMNSVAAGDMISALGTGTAAMIPVTVGNVYSFTGRVKSAVTARSTRLDVQWFTSGGASISTSTGGTVADNAATFTTVTNINLTAPATAAFAQIRVVVLATGAAAEVHYWDHIGCFNGATAPAWSRGGFYSPSVTMVKRYIVQYSDDAGLTWNDLRGTSGLGDVTTTNGSNQTATIYDYEFTPNKLRSYRVYAKGTESGTAAPVNSPYSGTQTATLDLVEWWIKDPFNSALNLQVFVTDEGAMTRRLPRGVFDVLGSAKSVVVKDIRHTGVEATLVLESTLQSEETALVAIFNSGHTLLLQSPSALGPINRYIEVGDVSEGRLSQIGTSFWREWSVPYVEVASP